jgi:hypothetical protein
MARLLPTRTIGVPNASGAVKRGCGFQGRQLLISLVGLEGRKKGDFGIISRLESKI